MDQDNLTSLVTLKYDITADAFAYWHFLWVNEREYLFLRGEG